MSDFILALLFVREQLYLPKGTGQYDCS